MDRERESAEERRVREAFAALDRARDNLAAAFDELLGKEDDGDDTERS